MSAETLCAKPGCEIAFEYAGTGRRPKYCPAHREKPRPDRVKPTSRKTGSKSLDVLRLELTQTLQGAGAMLMAVDQFDGLVIVQGTPKLVDALISMAEVNPEFRRFLESGTKSVVWLQLGTAVAAIAVPIAARHRLIPVNPAGVYQLFHGPLPEQFQPKPARNAPRTAPKTEAETPAETVAETVDPVDAMPGEAAA